VAADAVIGLVLAVLITGSVAGAAVTASYRRIGVLKSIGFTPAQVAAGYLAQYGLPALAGALSGTALGNRWAGPLIDAGPFHLRVGVPAWLDVLVPAAIWVLVGLAALPSAVRAGRLPTVRVIAIGQAPRAGRGYAVHRVAARLRVPRPASLGLAASITRLAPSLTTLVVSAAGLTAVVLAAGLDSQLASIVLSAGHATADVSLIRRLTLLVAVLAAIGVFSAVLMLARERVHDLGVLKALGMTPRQIAAMVSCWVIAPAIGAAVIALPAGVALERVVARAVITGQSARLMKTRPPGAADRPRPAAGGALRTGPGQVLPSGGAHRRIVVPPGAHPGRPALGAHPGLTHVYTPGALTLLALAALAIALIGALGPAVWAAASRTTTALRAE
jgi:ABC-type antimicrobial peptide transport system permease subunit